MAGKAPASLDELQGRLADWLQTVYHVRPHEGTGLSPNERFAQGSRQVRARDAQLDLEQLFYAPLHRVVRQDGTVRLENQLYEQTARHDKTHQEFRQPVQNSHWQIRLIIFWGGWPGRLCSLGQPPRFGTTVPPWSVLKKFAMSKNHYPVKRPGNLNSPAPKWLQLLPSGQGLLHLLVNVLQRGLAQAQQLAVQTCERLERD